MQPSSVNQSLTAATLKEHKLAIIIPVYKGAATIGDLLDKVVTELSPIIQLHEIIVVNDGSPDNSHDVILKAIERHPNSIKYIQLYRNFGEHNAVMCGCHFVTADSAVIIDDDFQNPPEEIIQLVRKLLMGYDVVYSYYEQKKHSWFRNLGSNFNDTVATLLLNKPKNLYLSSFKAIDGQLIKIITQYTGPYPYIDGLILNSTQNIGQQLVRHDDRKEGKSSYNLVKLIRLWLNMFTGFSILPLRLTSYLGVLVSFFALLLTIYFVIVRLFGPVLIDQEIPAGWASTIIAITFLAGLQLIMLGMIGEYLGRLFLTINGRPQFLIRKVHGVQTSQIPEAAPDEPI